MNKTPKIDDSELQSMSFKVEKLAQMQDIMHSWRKRSFNDKCSTLIASAVYELMNGHSLFK